MPPAPAPGSIAPQIVWTPRTVLLLIGVLWLMFVLAGCSAEQIAQLQTQRDQVAQTVEQMRPQVVAAQTQVDQLDQQIAALDVQIAAIAGDEPGDERAKLVAARNQLTVVRNRTQRILDVGDEALSRAKTVLTSIETELAQLTPDDPGAAINSGARVISPMLPPPYNLILAGAGTLLGGLATGLWQAKKRKQAEAAAASVVNAIELEKSGDGTVNFGDPQTKALLRSRMTDEAKALVENARARVQAWSKLIPPHKTTN